MVQRSGSVLQVLVLMYVPAPSWQTTRLLFSPTWSAAERLFFIHSDVGEDRLHVPRESCCQPSNEELMQLGVFPGGKNAFLLWFVFVSKYDPSHVIQFDFFFFF